MDDLDLLPDDNVSKDREERKNGGHGRLSIDDKEWDVINFQPIGEVVDASSTSIGVGNNDDLVAAID